MPQLLTGYGIKRIRLRAGIRNKDTFQSNRRGAVITILHLHRPKHCSIHFIDGIDGPTASGAACKYNPIRGGWRRRKGVLIWEMNAPKQSSVGSVKSLHQSVEVYNEDLSRIIGGIGKIIRPGNIR